MRKLHLLSTVAASLLLATGVAVAQGTKDETPARAPAAQQNAPAEKIAPSMHAGEHKGKAETTGQASEKMNGGKGYNAEMNAGEHGKAGTKSKSETTGQGSKASESGKAEMNSESKRGSSNKAMKNSTESKSGVNANENAERNSGATQKSSESVNSKSSTVGQGAAAGSAKLSTEQRTKITTIIRQHKVRPEHLNISVHVGARVPDTVHFYPLPVEVVDVYPEWRGYDFILVGDEILVVNPRTHLIIAVLEA
jgi:hypothetical protein